MATMRLLQPLQSTFKVGMKHYFCLVYAYTLKKQVLIRDMAYTPIPSVVIFQM